MNKELKDKWISALRSGDYKQGKARLHDPNSDSFCCLGVLCEILKVPRRDIKSGIDDTTTVYNFNNNESACYIPMEYGNNIGLLNITAVALAQMNDGSDIDQPKTFNEIADYIQVSINEETK